MGQVSGKILHTRNFEACVMLQVKLFLQKFHFGGTYGLHVAAPANRSVIVGYHGWNLAIYLIQI